MGQGEDMSGCQPQKHAYELGGQRFHHFALELRDVYLAELIDVCEDLFRQFFLIIFKQVDQKSRAAGDIELAAELVGRFFIHLTDQVEEELDYVGLETVNLRLCPRQH